MSPREALGFEPRATPFPERVLAVALRPADRVGLPLWTPGASAFTQPRGSPGVGDIDYDTATASAVAQVATSPVGPAP